MKAKRLVPSGRFRWRAHAIRPARILALSLILLSALAACATTAQKSSARDPVVERADARWAALLADDLETAYSFYSPGYRSATSLIDFGVSMRLRKVAWTGATYREHQCSDDRCTVTFVVDYRVRNPVPGLNEFDGKSEDRETWVKTGGEWWYVPNK